MPEFSKVGSVLFIAAVFAVSLSGGRRAIASEDTTKTKEPAPLEMVTVTSNQVLGILRSEELAGDENKPERMRQFREAIASKFDWSAIAQHGLGVHWRKRTGKEREEFTALFRRLLEQVYFRQLTIHGVDAELSYEKETFKDGRATVFTIADKKGVETRIDYVMRAEPQKEEAALQWLIYDVKVEGVSLLLNYREQFTEIIVSGGFESLMKKLKRKVEKAEKANKAEKTEKTEKS